MKRIIFLLFFACIYVGVYSQTVILERNVEQVDTSLNESVLDNKNALGLVVGFGFPVSGGDKGAKLKTLSSGIYKFGFIDNYKFSKAFSGGATLSYTSYNYSLKPEAGKSFPDVVFADSVSHDYESINLYTIDGGIYFRIQYAGENPGKYFDIGINEYYIISSNHRTRDELNDMDIEVIIHNPPYIENLQTLATFKVGFGGIGFNINYRLTDLFDEPYNYPELARLNILLELKIGG